MQMLMHLLLPMMLLQTPAPAPEYTIQAIRFGTIPGYSLSRLVVGAPDTKVDIATVMWLIRGGGKTILFDSGFYRQRVIDQFKVTDFVRPDEAVRLTGVDPSQVTDIILSHVHGDHMDGIDLFGNATVWIQQKEYEYYTGTSWQEGGKRGANPENVLALGTKNTQGKVKLIDVTDREILPGIRVFT